MPESSFLRSSDVLSARSSLLLVVDVQERFLPHIAHGDAVVSRCSDLLRGAEIFEVPVVVTTQYPRGLGEAVPALLPFLQETGGRVQTAEKLLFSAVEATGWPAAGDRTDGRHQVVIAGIETHICVLQTALDLLSLGYRVFVAADATGSRQLIDHEIACNRSRDSGAIVTTSEAVLFEWCERAGTDTFLQVRDLVKERARKPNA